MIKPPVKATYALEKPPAAKPLRSRWTPKDDPKLKVDVCLNQFSDTRTDTSRQRLLDWPLHMRAIYPSYKDRLWLYWCS